MLYDFCDTNQSPSAASLPAEALWYNGKYIDEEILLYRTLYVSGRESFSADIAETALESMDGSVFLRSRLLPRTITVGYQIAARSPHELMVAYNHLNHLMRAAQVEVSFADESDKYYIGTCRSIGTPEPGRLTVKAEMEIYCTDPCKYAVQETIVYPNSNGVFSIEYSGSYPVRPSFEAVFSGNAKQVMITGADAIVTAGDSESSAYLFARNDKLIIDCADAKIYLNDTSSPALGNIANQYEKMILTPGGNLITPSAIGTAPTFKMRYREAWL